MFEFDRRRGSSLFFILAIPTLLFSQYLSLRFNQKVKEDFAWVTHTFEVVHELQSMETSVLDVQSGQRGYIITLMPVHKDLMHHGIQQTLVHWDKAKELTSDNPVQQANLEQFKETLSARLVHAEKVIKARETQGFSASQSLIVEGGGTRLTNQLLSILEQMKVVESKLLAKREVAAHNSANASSLTVIFGGLFSTLLIGFAALLIRRDLKTRAFATRALTISEQKFRDTFNLSPIGVALTSTDGVWEEVNLTLCRMLGYAAEELIGHHFNEVTHPEDLEIGKRHTRSLNDHQANTVSYEKRYLSKAGETVYVLLHLTILRDEKGKALRLLVEILDISERKRIEQALRKEKDFNESITALVPNSIYVFDITSRCYVYSNLEFSLSLGYSSAEIESLGPEFIKMIIHPDDLNTLTDSFRAAAVAVNGPAIAENTIRIQNSSHEWKWVLSRMTVFKTDAEGKATQLIGVFQDISELKQREAELAQAVKTKAEFLANMSHEIRTPLNGIIATTDILLDTTLDAEQIRFTRIVQSSGLSLLTIINDILDFSKIEAGKMAMDTLEFPLTGVVEGQIELLLGKAREKDLELASFVSPALPLKVIGDPGRLGQILLNLIGNAIKFTEVGGVSVRMTKDPERQAAKGSIRVRVEVEDSGIGVPESVAEKLFKPFTQADGSTSRKYGGTGLGLSISKKLVELMGGEIGVKAKPGGGAIFWFTAEFLKPVPTAFLPTPHYLKDLRVLVCDVDLFVVAAIQEYLNAWNMRNERENSFAGALTRLQVAQMQGDPFRVFVVSKEALELQAEKLEALAQTQNPRLEVIVLDSVQSSDRKITLKPVKQSTLLDSMMTALGQQSVLESILPGDGNELRTEAQAVQRDSNRRFRILVAEDNSVNQIIALKILDTLGYTAQSVANGKEAVEILHQNPYDLVLMDCQMPEMDGYAASQQIRQSGDPQVKNIPIIALTANAMKGDEERCLAAGMSDYLSKPIRKDKLAEKLTLWLT